MFFLPSQIISENLLSCCLGSGNRNDDILVIVDQHAAHERVRLEDFTRGREYSTNSLRDSLKLLGGTTFQPDVRCSVLPKSFQVS